MKIGKYGGFEKIWKFREYLETKISRVRNSQIEKF